MTAKPVNSVQSLYFSPTESTRRIVETVAKGTGIRARNPISITTPQESDYFPGQIDGDLLFVGVPRIRRQNPFVRAISIYPESYLIEDETCIRCFACTSVCSSGAKTKIVQPAEQLAAWFRYRSTERGEPLLFL
jgi:ferredoxin